VQNVIVSAALQDTASAPCVSSALVLVHDMSKLEAELEEAIYLASREGLTRRALTLKWMLPFSTAA
jgi:hypothetical protein